RVMAKSKFGKVGVVCVSRSRILVHRIVLVAFTEKFVGLTDEIKVGNGLEAGTAMGPLANVRRIPAVVDLLEDAVRG
ncbi:aldehyde dehydrogenase family protein, partial [Pseudomonas syringae group genomosp. 7]|uniref:aldehyde dehydrogenase family protein n=1 Tax=Pseudomonas syringae group genomosp. 7 TaxID=251699 RepID=UPI00376F5B44